MYNRITEEKIKAIPQIAEIDINRLPQELTRIYAQIVSLRRVAADGTLHFPDQDLRSSLRLLQTLANNLETILLTFPEHNQKESIAFVAATANNLIFRMTVSRNDDLGPLLEPDNISPFVSSIILFLIGNSQADAAEMAMLLPQEPLTSSKTRQNLVTCVTGLATGNLARVNEIDFAESEIIDEDDFQEIAVNYLWRELGLGIKAIAANLSGQLRAQERSNNFGRVIELSVSDIKVFGQNSVYAGLLRLAKLLKILEEDILDKAVSRTPAPPGVDVNSWQNFLEQVASERPYLWENHKEALQTNFLHPGTSAVLTLPTGAGKSTLSELKLASCVFSGKLAVYLVPTHALEDQVNKNLGKLFADYFGNKSEYDGEYTESADEESSPILVMTPERCLTLLNVNPEIFFRVGLVVFDEFHLIHGTDIKKDRRSIDAMYCLLSLFTTIPTADYLLISAMVENGDEVSDWIATITNRECILFNSTWKPTRQLHGCLVFEDSDIRSLKETINLESRNRGERKTPPVRLKREMRIKPHCFFSLQNIWETESDDDYYRTVILDKNVTLGIGHTSDSRWYLTSNRNEVAASLAAHFANLGLKTLVFVDDPVKAKSTSLGINVQLREQKDGYEEYLRRNIGLVSSLEIELGAIDHSYFHYARKVGIHHGLLLPTERTLIERYFKEPNGALVLVATATLAQGINLPAEIVIIAGDDRYDEESEVRETVKPHELLNAAGRAGRAGQSSQGAVILIPGEIVAIENSTISRRWWDLKNRVFSKGDQCLTIQDPLEYFLDSIQDESIPLNATQTNILYRFKSESLSEYETKKLLKKSFYAYRSAKVQQELNFDTQVTKLLQRRNELDSLSEDIVWTKEISFKTGLDPSIILELGAAIDNENIDTLANYSVIELINWFFDWLTTDDNFLNKIFTKSNTISQIKRSIGLKQDSAYSNADIVKQIPKLKPLLICYVQGRPLNELDKLIPNSARPDKSPYLIKARNFVIRLVPELSFSFGLLSMIIVEKAQQNGIARDQLPWNVRVLASCVREGFDSAEKLFFKKNNGLLMRVETHLAFKAN